MFTWQALIGVNVSLQSQNEVNIWKEVDACLLAASTSNAQAEKPRTPSSVLKALLSGFEVIDDLPLSFKLWNNSQSLQKVRGGDSMNVSVKEDQVAPICKRTF